MKRDDAPLEINDREKTIAFDLFQRLKDIEEQYTGERIVGDPSSLNLDTGDKGQETLMADASTEMDQAPDSFLRPRRYDIIEGKELPAETLEDFDVMFRKPNATGGRVMLVDGGIAEELKNFVEQFKLKNNRIPTQNEIFKGTGRAAKTIKSYLTEGTDFAKPLTNLEAAKLGGKKATGITKVNKNLINQFNELKIKGIYPSIETSRAGSKSFRVKFDKKLGLKEIGGPATKEKLKEIKTTVSEVLESNNYTKNILPFQTTDEQKKYKAFKRVEYKNQDPRNIYKKLQDYKREKYPNLSFNENIQHGQSKFSTQTLSRFGLLPRIDNVEGPIKTVERIRDNNLKTTLATLKNPKASAAAKKAAAEKYNNIVKGLRGQLKGTNVKGFVNFETFNVDEKGNFKKIKDIGFDPKKGMAYNNILGNKSLAKLTDSEADEILKLGKKHIDLQLLPKTIEGLTTADKIARPEKALVRESFKRLSKPGIMGALKASRFLPVVGAIATPALAAYGLYDAYKKGYTRPDELLASAAFGSGVSLKDKIKYEKSKEPEDKDGLASLMA